eukprot:6201001-Pleurochrysis_carterae.AAC.1
MPSTSGLAAPTPAPAQMPPQTPLLTLPPLRPVLPAPPRVRSTSCASQQHAAPAGSTIRNQRVATAAGTRLTAPMATAEHASGATALGERNASSRTLPAADSKTLRLSAGAAAEREELGLSSCSAHAGAMHAPRKNEPTNHAYGGTSGDFPRSSNSSLSISVEVSTTILDAAQQTARVAMHRQLHRCPSGGRALLEDWVIL